MDHTSMLGLLMNCSVVPTSNEFSISIFLLIMLYSLWMISAISQCIRWSRGALLFRFACFSRVYVVFTLADSAFMWSVSSLGL